MGRTLILYATPKNWSAAEDYCISVKGHLASFPSYKDYDAHVPGLGNNVWVGGRRVPDTGDEDSSFEWLSGEVIPSAGSGKFTKWHAGDPNNVNSEDDDCLSIYKSGSGLADWPCSQEQAFVCEFY